MKPPDVKGNIQAVLSPAVFADSAVRAVIAPTKAPVAVNNCKIALVSLDIIYKQRLYVCSLSLRQNIVWSLMKKIICRGHKK